jgi:choline-sulfatase
MYEESVAVPLIMAGAGLPCGESRDDLVTLVDSYQTILEAVGQPLLDEEQELPGRSLWPIAAGDKLERIAFSEYHAVASHGASYMVRRGRYKYVHYVSAPAQLFDLDTDPQEVVDLAADPQLSAVRNELEMELRGLLDPDAMDRLAKSDQLSLIERHGGRDAVLRRGTFVNSPVPGEQPTFTAKRD